MTYITITRETIKQSNEIYSLERFGLDGDYSVLSPEQMKKRKEILNDRVEYQIRTSYKNACRRKADLVVEGAEALERAGVDDGWVINWTKDRDGLGYYQNQSWYLFKENGNWYFKMYESCKAKHLIEGVGL